MSNQEFVYWRSYFNVKAKLVEESSKPKKSGVSGQQLKKFMGGNTSEVPSA